MRIFAQYHPRDKKRLREGSDPELSLVYHLFHIHGWAPSQYYDKSQGEKDLIWALASYELERRNELLDINSRLGYVKL